jgi:dethiobiotin synthetase
MMHLFVTGTDTGVGKTTVAAGLLAAARKRGVTTAAMKPVESGWSEQGDAELLRAAAGNRHALALVRPYTFAAPVAPGVAAAAEAVEIDLSRIAQIARDMQAEAADLLLIEGAGGILVPLGGGHLMVDLARLLALPLLVVARDALGTINHTLLTVEAARARGLTVRGVILVSSQPDEGSRELTESNLREIERAGGVTVIGRLPFLARRELSDLAAACEPLLAALLPS